MYQGIWGTICGDGWDDTDATVVCRELGFLNGTATSQAQFDPVSDPVWLSQVECLGNESKLSHCMHSGAGNIMNCSHAQDVGVKCNAHGKFIYACIHIHMYNICRHNTQFIANVYVCT